MWAMKIFVGLTQNVVIFGLGVLFFWPLDAFIDSVLSPETSFAIFLLEPSIEEMLFRFGAPLFL